MRTVRHRLSLLGIVVVAVACVSVMCFLSRPTPEPVCNGHRLSEWLAMYDSSLRFPTNDGRHPPFTDGQIEDALDKIGPEALPFLRQWLVKQPSTRGRWLNSHVMKRLPFVRFRFAVDESRLDSLAETGFQYYGERAQPLLPWLLQLSKGRNPSLRMRAYEAAFFTRPEKKVFLRLADQALQDSAAGCQAMAAQWTVERFPEEATQRHVHFP